MNAQNTSHKNIQLTVAKHKKGDNLPLPEFLQPRARSGESTVDPLLAGVKVKEIYELGAASRGEVKAEQIAGDENELLAIEAEDGSMIFIRSDKLAEDIERVRPEAVTDGVIDFSQFRDPDTASRGVGDILWKSVCKLELPADGLIEKARELAKEWIEESALDMVKDAAYDVSTYYGAKALMWLIESRLAGDSGLYEWKDPDITKVHKVEKGSLKLQEKADNGEKMLILIHGTASYTQSAFEGLRGDDASWDNLEQAFPGGIYGFEHRTFSQSPLENALELLSCLPENANISLLTHSRGGLVGDLLALSHNVKKSAAEHYCIEAADEDDTKTLKAAEQEERERFTQLLDQLSSKNIRVERYARVACPSNGTRFLSDNLEAALSDFTSLLQYGGSALAGLAAGAIGGPAAAKTFGDAASSALAVLKRLALEIAGRRIDPHMVPGIAAMCIDSPIARFLAHADVHMNDSTQLAVISGDTQFDSFGLSDFRRRIANLFCDWRMFDQYDNDLVVDTDSMYAGLTQHENSYYLFDQDSSVSHFRYFKNQTTRDALCGWLQQKELKELPQFLPLSGEEKIPWAKRDARIRRSRGGVDEQSLPALIFLPGIMGSHLEVDRKTDDETGSGNRIWFEPGSLAFGGIDELADVSVDNAHAEDIFEMFYGDLAEYLSVKYEVSRYPYDWRKPLKTAAAGLAGVINDEKLEGRCINILAHSMGGLVVRMLMQEHPEAWDKVVASGGRLLMLGTPNNGSHQMVHSLLGKHDATRMLARLDLKFGHDLQHIVDIIRRFPGALSLLPKPGFVDAGDTSANIMTDNYYNENFWEELKHCNRDRWFGNGIAGIPGQALLDEIKSLWGSELKDNTVKNPEVVSYICGHGKKTPCGLRKLPNKRLKLVFTEAGDGTVTWKSSRLDNLSADRYWYMPVSHGDLTDEKDYFQGIEELLAHGHTDELERLPVQRDGALETTFVMDAPPPVNSDAPRTLRALVGSEGRSAQKTARSRKRLTISIRCGDLAYCTSPVLCGHYHGDVISGAEAILDARVDYKLSRRKQLDAYPDDIGTSAVVLLPPNPEEAKRNSRRGAVIVGLGELNGRLTSSGVTESVRAGVIQYLLRIADLPDSCNKPSVKLTSLLIGQNSTARISIAESLAAVIQGVCEANARFDAVNVGELEFIELYRDIAITAAHSTQRLNQRLASELARSKIELEIKDQLIEGIGALDRLSAADGGSYWPRLIVTDAQREELECPPECYEEEKQSSVIDEALRELLADDYAKYRKSHPIKYDDDSPLKHKYPEKLRYVFVSERARSETVALQRQPGLIESIVRLQVKYERFNPQLSRTLFELMVPLDSKPMMREMTRLVLQVDNYTANLPWELLQGDDCDPLVLKTAIIRQLATTRFRRNVRSSTDKTACIISNPSTQGYGKYFGKSEDEKLSYLKGAVEECNLIKQKLLEHDYTVNHSRSDSEALDVLHKLMSRPYRILIIAGHGIFNARHRDGVRRTGVVLSDGCLITAAEIGQMEIVPDLVFLNCCHIGQISTNAEFNKLAYSVSQELIKMGVRCIIAAGWAVDDNAAKTFAERFFEEMLQGKQTFGDAVFEARKATYAKHARSNTWGAYQAYGDPGYRLDPGSAGGNYSSMKFTSLHELMHELRKIRLRSQKSNFVKASIEELDQEINKLRERGLSAWFDLPEVMEMLGKIYAEIAREGFTRAREYYIRAIAMEDNKGIVAIKTIEQLANMEARAGARHSDKKQGEEWIKSAISRLEALNEISLAGTKDQIFNSERSALLGSACKRYVDFLIKNTNREKDVKDYLKKAAMAYKRAGGKAPELYPYGTLNYLQFGSLSNLTGGKDVEADILLAESCANTVRQRFKNSGDFFDAVMVADAEVTKWLLGHAIKLRKKGQKVEDVLSETYLHCIEDVPSSDRQMDSVTSNLRTLAKIMRRLKTKNHVERARTLDVVADKLASKE